MYCLGEFRVLPLAMVVVKVVPVAAVVAEEADSGGGEAWAGGMMMAGTRA
jgi:hypothetical protein